jgi:hypothetical protein
VSLHDAGGGELLDMGMRVDTARQDEPAGRIDLLPACRQVEADRGDRPPRIPTSAPNVSDAVATVPPRITVSKGSRCHGQALRAGHAGIACLNGALP